MGSEAMMKRNESEVERLARRANTAFTVGLTVVLVVVGGMVLFVVVSFLLCCGIGTSFRLRQQPTDSQTRPSIPKFRPRVSNQRIIPTGQAPKVNGGGLGLMKTGPQTGIADPRLVRRLEGHGSLVNCVAFSADDRFAASGSGTASFHSDNSIRIWDLRSGMEVTRLE